MSEWRRASGCSSDCCIEVLALPDGIVQMRPALQPLISIKWNAIEWADFIAGVKAGEFDDLGGNGSGVPPAAGS